MKGYGKLMATLTCLVGAAIAGAQDGVVRIGDVSDGRQLVVPGDSVILASGACSNCNVKIGLSPCNAPLCQPTKLGFQPCQSGCGEKLIQIPCAGDCKPACGPCETRAKIVHRRDACDACAKPAPTAACAPCVAKSTCGACTTPAPRVAAPAPCAACVTKPAPRVAPCPATAPCAAPKASCDACAAKPQRSRPVLDAIRGLFRGGDRAPAAPACSTCNGGCATGGCSGAAPAGHIHPVPAQPAPQQMPRAISHQEYAPQSVVPAALAPYAPPASTANHFGQPQP